MPKYRKFIDLSKTPRELVIQDLTKKVKAHMPIEMKMRLLAQLRILNK